MGAVTVRVDSVLKMGNPTLPLAVQRSVIVKHHPDSKDYKDSIPCCQLRTLKQQPEKAYSAYGVQ